MNKEQKIKTALAKLTEEEKVLLKLIKPIKTHHKLKIYYMIGDADGNTTEESNISINNPFLKTVKEVLDWVSEGEIFSVNEYFKEENKIRDEDENNEILFVIFNDLWNIEKLKKYLTDNNFEPSDENINFLREFDDLLISEMGFNYLSFEKYKVV
jgi:hypothetical protein